MQGVDSFVIIIEFCLWASN